MNYDVIIIGAGASGLFAATQLDKKIKTLVIEKNNKAGIKLLITGAGQCNITNFKNIKEFQNNYGKNGKFLKHALFSFDNKKLIDFFENLGIKCVIRPDDKVFPESFDAKSIVRGLQQKNAENDVKIHFNEEVVNVDTEERGFSVRTAKNNYFCDKLIIACGGKSYPKTGSNGDGYIFAEKLGHTLIEPRPALTSISVKNYFLKELSGISVTAKIILWKNGKKYDEFSGDLLLTHSGLSGPIILHMSRYIEIGDKITIDFVREIDLNEKMLADFQVHSKMSIKNYMKNYTIPQRLIESLLDNANVSFDKQLCEITKEERKRILSVSCELTFEIKGLGNFDTAMVTAGGVKLQEINNKTMESKILPNLYFIGETLDIDGDTGGYNLQAAFSTAFCAAHSINKDFNKDDK